MSRALMNAANIVRIVLCVVFLIGTSVRAADEYVWGESNASMSNDPGFEGYWKYDVTVSWDVAAYSQPGHALSHVSVILGLENCVSVCTDDYFAFPDTVGSSQGESLCMVYYYVEFNCRGDPTVPDHVPTIKFEPFPSPCEPDVMGTASVCFYSIAPPDTESTELAFVWIKFGRYVERGTIEGVLPKCLDDPASTETSAWGAIKSLFR